jgi:hypothetical protein
MKKLLLGMMLLASFSSFAQEGSYSVVEGDRVILLASENSINDWQLDITVRGKAKLESQCRELDGSLIGKIKCNKVLRYGRNLPMTHCAQICKF